MRKNFSKVLVLLLVFTMVLSSGALAANTNYTVDMSKLTDQQMIDIQINLTFNIEGKETRITGNNDMGYPIKMEVEHLGGFTLVPIRLICEALGLSVSWTNPVGNTPGYATIGTPNHGTVKLYMGATSITAADGTVYKETAYKFPDGSSVPLCLNRNGRIYVPVRFLSTFVIDGATFEWKNKDLTVVKEEVEESYPNAWKGVGANVTKYFGNSGTTLEECGMYNLAKLVEEGGHGYRVYGSEIIANGTSVRTLPGDESTPARVKIEGIKFNSQDDKYETLVAMVKDMLDAESATAFIKWADPINEILEKKHELLIKGKYGTDEYNSLLDEFNKVSDEMDSGKIYEFGNVYMQYDDGDNAMEFWNK